jgi:hypothetical protein
MSMILILIKIKFDIEINNDEVFTNIWEHKKREKKLLSPTVHYNTEPKYV